VVALVVGGAVAVAAFSGGSSADPRTPAGLPGLPPPFLGTAVVGDGGLTAAIDAYGDVVDLRAPGPAGRALIENPTARQAAGTVAPDTGVVPRVRVGSVELPLWRADRVWQRYRPGTGVVVTGARFGSVRVRIVYAAAGRRLGCLLYAGSISRSAHGERSLPPELQSGGAEPRAPLPRVGGPAAEISMAVGEPAAGSRLRCDDRAARRIVQRAEDSDRRWLARARPLGAAAPAWAREMYRRSLLTLRALTDRRTGAVAAGARDGWAYVWPRDAATAALAYAAAGYRPEARRVAEFLAGLDLGAAARFDGAGAPIPGREAQGDAGGWVAAAARATGARAAGAAPPRAAGLASSHRSTPWRDRPDYQEGAPGDYLANAIASAAETAADGPKTLLYGGQSAHRPSAGEIKRRFGGSIGLVRRAGDPASGLDSAAAWAVRPFSLPALFPTVRRTLLRLAGSHTTSRSTAATAPAPSSTRFGIAPAEAWPGVDPWTAPTAWSAWSLAALSDQAVRAGVGDAARRDRRAALRLLDDLRRAATPAGALPERVDARTGIPRSTTPLAWSHAFAILTLRELWP
jgi:glucoamylase